MCIFKYYDIIQLIVDKLARSFFHSFCGIVHFLETFINPKNLITSINNANAVVGHCCDTSLTFLILFL